MKSRFVLLGVLVLSVAERAMACGVCVEDKMAATYDHAVVTDAQSHGKVVVFCEVSGTLKADLVRRALAKVPGVQARSIRTSAQPAALSFVVDPKIVAPQAAVQRADLALRGVMRLTLLRTLEPDVLSKPQHGR